MKKWREQFKYWWMRNFSRGVVRINFEDNPYIAGDILVIEDGIKFIYLGKCKMKLMQKTNW